MKVKSITEQFIDKIVAHKLKVNTDRDEKQVQRKISACNKLDKSKRAKCYIKIHEAQISLLTKYLERCEKAFMNKNDVNNCKAYFQEGINYHKEEIKKLDSQEKKQ